MTFREFLSKAFSPSDPAGSGIGSSTNPDTGEEKEVSLKDLKTAYYASCLLNRAVRIRASLTMARGYTINYPSSRSEEIIQQFFKDIKRNSFTNSNFTRNLRMMFIDTDIYGNSYSQLIKNKKGDRLVKMQQRHPQYMDLQRGISDNVLLDDNELPKGYVYKSDNGMDEAKFERPEIAHLIFETVGGEWLGKSLFLPVYAGITQLANIEFGIAQAMYKHGMPTVVIKIGDETHKPKKQDIKDATTEVQGMMASNEYVAPYWYDVDVLNPSFPSETTGLLDYFARQVSVISGIPLAILLGAEKTFTRFTAEFLDKHLFLMISEYQDVIKTVIENQIFRPALDIQGCSDEAEFIWNAEPDRFDVDIAKLIPMLADVLVEGKPVVTWNEARNFMKLPIEAPDPIVSQKLEHLASPSPSDAKSTGLAGLYLVEPHGKYIWDGAKTVIIKSVKFSSRLNEPLYLLSDNKCFGIIMLGEPKELPLVKFDKYYKMHTISTEERKKWWPNINTFFMYPVTTMERFEPPRHWNYVPGTQIFVKDVKL